MFEKYQQARIGESSEAEKMNNKQDARYCSMRIVQGETKTPNVLSDKKSNRSRAE